MDRHPVERITIFEASGGFGPGCPYREDECPGYLMNTTTDSMCLIPSNTRAFLTWLEGRPDLQPVPEEEHLPRRLFGTFLKEVFAATRTAAAVKDIAVELVPAEVTAAQETRDDRVHIAWEGGEVEVDAAILITGRCPDVDPYSHSPAGLDARCIANHVMSEEFEFLPPDACVHVLGSSLSAFDVINRLFSPESGCRSLRRDGTLTFEAGTNRRHVVLCSRSGRLTAVTTSWSTSSPMPSSTFGTASPSACFGATPSGSTAPSTRPRC